MRDELSYGEQARDAVRFVTTPIRSRNNPMVALAHQTLIQAAIGILPPWGREMLGLRQPTVVDWAMVRPATHLIMNTLRFAGGTPPPIAEARRRCAAEPSVPAPA
jgi:uncharacterized protein (DUF2236 family)